MPFRLLSTSIVAPLLLLPLLAYADTSAEQTIEIATIIDAQPIKRIAPKYPLRALQNEVEGWAKLSYVVDKNGHVSDVIIDDYIGGKYFANAAVNAIKKWQFSPAMENGKPVEQCKKSVRMDFRMGNAENTNKISRKFYAKYRKITNAFTKNNLSEVKNYLNRLIT